MTPIRTANRVSVELACQNNGLGRLSVWDWLWPPRARRRLLDHRERFARLFARELRRRQGLPPESEDPDVDLMMAAITRLVRASEIPPGSIVDPRPLLP